MFELLLSIKSPPYRSCSVYCAELFFLPIATHGHEPSDMINMRYFSSLKYCKNMNMCVGSTSFYHGAPAPRSIKQFRPWHYWSFEKKHALFTGRQSISGKKITGTGRQDARGTKFKPRGRAAWVPSQVSSTRIN